MSNFLSGLLIGATSGAFGQGCADLTKLPSDIRRNNDVKSLIITENIERQKDKYIGQVGRNDRVTDASTKILINELFINKFGLDKTSYKTGTKYNFSDDDWFQIARLLNSSGLFYILHMYTQEKIEQANETAEQVSLAASSGASATFSGISLMKDALGEGIDDFTKLLNDTIGPDCSNFVQGTAIALAGIGASKIISKLLTNLKTLVFKYNDSKEKNVKTYQEIEAITSLTKQQQGAAQRELYIKETFKDAEPGDMLRLQNFLSSQNVKLQMIASEYQSKLEEKNETINKMQSEYRTNTYNPAKNVIHNYEIEARSSVLRDKDKSERNKEILEINNEVIKRIQQVDSEKASKFAEIEDDITNQFNIQICDLDIDSINQSIEENDANIKELNYIYSVLTQTAASKIINVTSSVLRRGAAMCRRSVESASGTLEKINPFSRKKGGKTRKNKNKNKRHSRRKNKRHSRRKNKRHPKRRTRK